MDKRMRLEQKNLNAKKEQNIDLYKKMIYYLFNARKIKMFILKYVVGDGLLKRCTGTIFAAFSALCITLLSGCGKNEDETKKAEIKKDYDICIYNSDRDNEEKFREMCDEYTNRTGVIIKTITPSEEDDTVENLESYLSSESAPDIFTVNNIEELKKWKSDGSIGISVMQPMKNLKKLPMISPII